MYLYIYIHLPFLLPFLGLENPSDLPNRVAISLHRGASPEVLYQSWIQTRIKEQRVMGEERTQRIRVAAMEEGANLVNVGSQKTS
jgi:hypothetical protein